MKNTILQFIRGNMVFLILVAVISIMVFYLWQDHKTINQLITIAADHQKTLTAVQLGNLPLIKSKFQDKEITYPFPSAMILRWDNLILELSKTSSLSKDFLFFPDRKQQDLFKL